MKTDSLVQWVLGATARRFVLVLTMLGLSVQTLGGVAELARGGGGMAIATAPAASVESRSLAQVVGDVAGAPLSGTCQRL